jgi:hypothetical protein
MARIWFPFELEEEEATEKGHETMGAQVYI